MAKITLTGNEFIDLTDIDISELYVESSSIFQSADLGVVDVTDPVHPEDHFAFVFQGTGLGDYDSHGYARVGTIDAFSYVVAGVSSVDWTGLTVDADAFEHAIKNGNTNNFIEFLWGGNDKVSLNQGGAAFHGFDGNDKITGKNGLDVIFGDDGNDRLNGAGDADTLVGGMGRDTLTGGTLPDRYVFENVAESTIGSIDLITDLAGEDTIDLSEIDADISTAGDDAFFIAAAFTGVAGQLVLKYKAGPDRTIIQGDVDGDGNADLVIYASGDQTAHGNFDF